MAGGGLARPLVRLSGKVREASMPLHDWTELPGWEGVHQVWMVELLYWLKPRLPAGYRAYIGTTPKFAIGVPANERPDGGARDWQHGNGPQPSASQATGRTCGHTDQAIAGDALL